MGCDGEVREATPRRWPRCASMRGAPLRCQAMTDSNLDTGQAHDSEGSRTPPGSVAAVGSIGTSGAATLAERLGVGAYTLRVVEVVALAHTVRRLRVGATEEGALTGFSFQPGQDLMLDVARQGERTVRRRYTIRRFDPGRELIDLDFVLHGEGPAARWAAQAGPGTCFEAIGPRGKVSLDPEATWHLFVGDDAFVPAVGAMLDALPPGCRAVAVLEVDSTADARSLGKDMRGDDQITVRFVERADRPVGQTQGLLDALDAIDAPPEQRHCYVAGEHHVVVAVRKALAAKGFAAHEVSPKAYWRLGQANAEHGEPADDR
jgi:NADPH-dependent ferric siderophore reductase